MRCCSIVLALTLPVACWAELHNCSCDAAKAESLAERQCSIDRSLQDAPTSPAFLFLKDTNPTKRNRTLAIPRVNVVRLAEMSSGDRAQYWNAAIAKARELWGDEWGIAMNGESARTQCHLHLHLGKLRPDAELPDGVTVDGTSVIPVPEGTTGLWVHAVNGKLHVHAGQQINETVLIR